MSRDAILHKVRTALGRSVGQAPEAPPDLYFNPVEMSLAERVGACQAALEALAGKVHVVANAHEAREYVAARIANGQSVASNSPYLAECGICSLTDVRSGITDREELRGLCATADFGITSADFAIASTGSLVMIASPAEARLISLLPPVHIAVVPCSRLLTSLDELFTRVPDPARVSSSMVLITGPSRTADIEQILVRGVHGPGEIHVVLVEG